MSIDPTELVLPVGDTRELNVTVLDPTGNPMPGSAYEITWSNGGSYADVYASGTYCRVTGYQAGYGGYHGQSHHWQQVLSGFLRGQGHQRRAHL